VTLVEEAGAFLFVTEAGEDALVRPIPLPSGSWCWWPGECVAQRRVKARVAAVGELRLQTVVPRLAEVRQDIDLAHTAGHRRIGGWRWRPTRCASGGRRAVERRGGVQVDRTDDVVPLLVHIVSAGEEALAETRARRRSTRPGCADSAVRREFGSLSRSLRSVRTALRRRRAAREIVSRARATAGGNVRGSKASGRHAPVRQSESRAGRAWR